MDKGARRSGRVSIMLPCSIEALARLSNKDHAPWIETPGNRETLAEAHCFNVSYFASGYPLAMVP